MGLIRVHLRLRNHELISPRRRYSSDGIVVPAGKGTVNEDITVSTPVITKRKTPADIRAQKGKVPVVSLTAYTAPIARLLDPVVDLLLVGDSLGMVLYGFDTTIPVTLDIMIAHGAAVVRSSKQGCVIVDMPFGSYQASPAEAFKNSARVMAETGCAGVKLEGGVEMADTIRFLVERGIPVLAHIGLQPQSVNAIGGFRVQGRTDAGQAKILADARAVTDAGAFAVVVEGTAEPVARAVTNAIAIPTIGIGASAACDGQVLVIDDVLGMISDVKPRFVKHYAELAPLITAAATAYADDVRARRFPGPEHVYAATS
jgi:3-methyl-2-oxobutanoate hydroxymethyltransferase